MQTKQTDNQASPDESRLPKGYEEFGLTFKGKIVSLDSWKDWKDQSKESKPVIGKSIAVGLTDGIKIYTWGLKIREGNPLPDLAMLQDVKVRRAAVYSDMGQHRITGTL